MESASRRFAALLGGDPPEHTVVFPMVVADHAAHIAGRKVPDVVHDAEALATVLYDAWSEYGYDMVMVFADTVVEAEAMGAEVEFPEDDNAFIVTPPAPDRLHVSDPLKDGRVPVMLEATRILKRRLGDDVPLITSIKGPFSVAAFVAGIETLLADVICAPDEAHGFLKLALENQVAYVRAIVEAGGVPFIGDPVASGSLISPKVFREFAQPYLADLIDEIHGCGCWAGLHICGETTDVLVSMKQTGADVLSVDGIDLANARKKVGPDAILMGNVSTQLVRSGTPDGVRSASQACIDKAGPSLVLCTACDVPKASPKENVRAMVDTARN